MKYMLILFLTGCQEFDYDKDGYLWFEDCTDGAADVYPGAPENCNGRDDDCDGEVDEDPIDPTYDTYFYYHRDYDHDGYGDPEQGSFSCTQPAGYVESSSDCNDGNSDVNPGVEEVCDDGVDNDCDGDLDLIGSTWTCADLDGDGEGASGSSEFQEICDMPEGWMRSNGTDCYDNDDSDPAVQ